jgi:uncharacterized membrane protein YfhO
LGIPGGTGDVEIRRDESENVLIRVRAVTDGFLFLSDQDYPGWHATVNGNDVPILRANYAFRAVRVPMGESTVVFHYRPMSVYVGALVSLLSWAAAIFCWHHARTRRTATRSDG